MEEEKKPGIAMIIAMKHKKAQDEAGDKDEDKKFEEIAQDILDAIKEESASDLTVALKAFIKVLEADEEE